jgi:succinate-semialdehyde dehydrogenase/glutarate-semialdehyde dehydrogenase
VFGPVAQLHVVPDLDAALELANDTEFGLGSNAWTNDPAEQERFARELDAGMVFINGMTASYPGAAVRRHQGQRLRRELCELGIREFCNAKTVWVGESRRRRHQHGAAE